MCCAVLALAFIAATAKIVCILAILIVVVHRFNISFIKLPILIKKNVYSIYSNLLTKISVNILKPFFDIII